MENNKRFISLKTKIMLSTLIPIVISYLLISSIVAAMLFRSRYETATVNFLQVTDNYASDFENKINDAMNYMSIVAGILEFQVRAGVADREQMQKTVSYIFNNYDMVDGSSIYFEPDCYDGRDGDYVASTYGTKASGRICYYFYRIDGRTAYLPEAFEDDLEFDLPHYTNTKESNKPIFTEPVVYEVDGQDIPMFTLTQPIQNRNGDFIGAVTVDVFLGDLYQQLQDERVYKTGYMIIANDAGQVIYSPRFEDVGKTREEVGLHYALPSTDEKNVMLAAKSILNGKNSLLTMRSIYIPKLDGRFYISVSAPKSEIYSGSIGLMALLVLFNLIVVISIALFIHYLLKKISTPIMEIAENANQIANGQTDELSDFSWASANEKTTDEVHVLYEAMKKMLSQLNGMQQLKLETLEMKHEKEKAQAAAKAKNDFLARMSHEIRTPMNAVMGMSELILRRKLPQDVYENALGIKTASGNLLSIINDILDFSKIESGKMEIVAADYMFSSLINDVIGIIRMRLMEKPIQFVTYIDPRIPAHLYGDEIRIRQILLNLLSNAVKYTKEGFVSLTASSEIDGDVVNLRIEVEDNGIGIKEEDLEKLFGDFTRIDMDVKEIEGTGLGLAITRNLCRAMGGDITVRSEYGKGSAFTALLPQGFVTDEPFAPFDPSNNPTVLLYEARRLYRESILYTLERLNIKHKSVKTIPLLFENMEEYDYVFISSFMYESIWPTLAKLAHPPRLVLLADITETMAPKEARILSLPAHPLSLANVLSDVYQESGDLSLSGGASFTAPDVKLLLVDDISANLKVAEGLMAPYEMNITTCMSGKEALRLVTANQYDLVFMDHMMPEMDGLEATRRIRAMDGDYYKNLPIIALTANAVSGVREMFIQNGMNDFLAKPIEMVKLDAILEKWINKDRRRKASAPKQEEEASDFVKSLRSLPQLDVDKALSIIGGSPATYERIVKISIRLIPENIARMEEFIQNKLSDYAIEVHGIKGVLNNMGAYGLGEAALRLEEASKANDGETCRLRHPGFMKELKEFGEVILGLMEEVAEGEKPAGDKEALAQALSKIEEAVDFFDAAQALEVIETIRPYSFGREEDQAIAAMIEALERFQFDDAEALLHQLMKNT